MMKNTIFAAALAVAGVITALPASAYTVEQDGLGMWVFFTQNGQSVDFRVEAEFASGSGWIGTTMDAFSLQFGNVGKGGNVASWSLNPTSQSANAGGPWTGYADKIGGPSGCSADTDDAICYSVDPAGEGGDGGPVIAATSYFWEFTVTFVGDFDVASMLAESNSVKFLSLELKGNDEWGTGGQLSQSAPWDDCCEKDVPEPGSLALLGLGLLGLALGRKRAA